MLISFLLRLFLGTSWASLNTSSALRAMSWTWPKTSQQTFKSWLKSHWRALWQSNLCLRKRLTDLIHNHLISRGTPLIEIWRKKHLFHLDRSWKSISLQVWVHQHCAGNSHLQSIRQHFKTLSNRLKESVKFIKQIKNRLRRCGTNWKEDLLLSHRKFRRIWMPLTKKRRRRLKR